MISVPSDFATGILEREGEAGRTWLVALPRVILHLLPTAPPELVSAAHKVLARLAHPDVGGDTATMQMINGAVERIREVSR